MGTVNCVSLVFFVILQVATANLYIHTAKMEGGDNCGYSYTVLDKEYGHVFVRWYGQQVDSGCELRFNIDSDIDKACVTTLTHQMPDCRPKIRFYLGYDSDYKTMDCYSGKVDFCSDGESKITIRFHNMDTTTSSNVTIKVYGVNEDDDDDDFNYSYLIQPIATAAGVVLVLIGTVIGWCVFLKISRKKEQQRKAAQAANPPKTWAQQAQEQQAQGYPQGYTYNTQQNAMYPVVPPPGGAPNPPYGKV